MSSPTTSSEPLAAAQARKAALLEELEAIQRRLNAILDHRSPDENHRLRRNRHSKLMVRSAIVAIYSSQPEAAIFREHITRGKAA
ncbi:hypothetical protein IVB16_41245 (plasmid) [Bradyrhizobium sp. 183]|uniref:hypothetical protein n=1 Tax=unclassified Bradyrhizobium TaxID=2631580 RepID=UPI0020002C7B|nr:MULTISPECIES: hypothetical protein [unclassified Bradyrhizobium]UPJ84947.1 hypothetical protein IVB17_41465 [Bradyrhizobium sp. 184]UPJ92757.1 hypothetical protein IVB16_41245 [Bradyrhizobium sp. 183]